MPSRGVIHFAKSILPAIGIALFPKCPMCWAAYMSMFGAVGFGSIPYQPWIPFALLGMVAINTGILLYSGLRGLGYFPFVLGLLGTSSVAVSKFILSYEPGMFIGVGLIFASSLVGSLRPILREYKQTSNSLVISPIS